MCSNAEKLIIRIVHFALDFLQLPDIEINIRPGTGYKYDQISGPTQRKIFKLFSASLLFIISTIWVMIIYCIIFGYFSIYILYHLWIVIDL